MEPLCKKLEREGGREKGKEREGYMQGEEDDRWRKRGRGKEEEKMKIEVGERNSEKDRWGRARKGDAGREKRDGEGGELGMERGEREREGEE